MSPQGAGGPAFPFHVAHLSTRELLALFADVRLVVLVKLHDKVVRIGLLGGLNDGAKDDEEEEEEVKR